MIQAKILNADLTKPGKFSSKHRVQAQVQSTHKCLTFPLLLFPKHTSMKCPALNHKKFNTFPKDRVIKFFSLVSCRLFDWLE